VPAVLTGVNSKGAKETAKAILYYAVARKKAYNFKVYRDEKVKAALSKLCYEKCAYCESRFFHVYPGDVEHFRPKGEITGANPLKPGYYWLAAEWQNLLLSCRNCNQKLKHLIHGSAVRRTMGKMNQFPLLNNDQFRVRLHTSMPGVSAEEPYRLLLDPTVDDPEKHLEYDPVHAVIKPKKINNTPSAKGIQSIETYVLQRVPLVLAREKVLIEILAQIQRVKEAIQNVSDHLQSDVNIQFYYDQIMKREMKRLKRFMEPTEEYSAMAKQVVIDFLTQNNITV